VVAPPAEHWDEVINPLETLWRERPRLAHRTPEVPDLRLIDRRGGVVCRRKAARVGGRRRTDVGALLATGTGAGH
jgi:hypothetical protein